MTSASVTGFVAMLREGGVLEAAALAEVSEHLQGRFARSEDLARELIHRGWLTAYQVEQVEAGRGADLVLGPYVLLEPLGEGGMGQVFKARHRRLNRLTALKLIRSDWLAEPEAVTRFHREARAAAQLAHPNIVVVYDAGEVEGKHYLAMEYLPGIDLARLVKQNGPLAVARACTYARQAALGLQHAHDCGLVHRDVKPANLLLTTRPGAGDQPPEEIVKILDLGLARVPHGLEPFSAATVPGALLGSLDYLAPEQAIDPHTVDIRADLYSLGCTLYHLLAGQAPFAGAKGMEILFKHRSEHPPSLERVRPEVSSAVAAVVRKLMAKRPEDRYQTPAAVAADLARAVASGPEPEPAPDDEATAAGGPAAAAPARETNLPLARTTVHGPAAASRPPLARARRRALAGMMLLVLPVGAVLWAILASGRRPEPPGPQAPLSLDRLSWETIPRGERYDWQPKEQLVVVLGEHRRRLWGPATGVAVHPSGKVVVGCGNDRAIRLWDVATGREVITIHHGGDNVYRIAFSPDGTLLAALDVTNVKLWDARTGQEWRALPGTEDALHGLAFARDGQRLAAAGLGKLPQGGGAMQVWDVRTGQTVALRKGSTKANWTVAFGADGNTLASGGKDRTVRLWDVAREKERQTLAAHGEDEVTGLAFAPDGKTLLSAGNRKGEVRQWDVATGARLPFPEGQPVGWRLAHDPHGGRFATAWADGHVRLWNASTGKLLGASVEPHPACFDLSWAHDAALLATAHTNGAVRLWSTDDLKEQYPLAGHKQPPGCVAFAADGLTVATGSQDTTAKLWDVGSGKERATLRGHSLGIHRLAFAPVGQALATAGADRLVKLWDASTGTATGTLMGHTDEILCLAYAADGRTLATGSRDRTVRVWDVSRNKEPAVLAGHKGAVRAVALTSNGKTLVSAGADNDVILWDLTARQELLRLKSLPDKIVQVAFAPDDHTVALGGAKGTVRVWDTAAGQEQSLLPLGLKEEIRLVAFTPDGAALTAVSRDGQVVRWDRTDRRKALTMKLPGRVHGAALAPDGRHVATANANNTVYILRLAPPPTAAK